MFQVQAEGLRTEFPPLRTVDRTPGNLRPPTTSFIGRESELAELETALKAHRLVTLTGVGGVGKTRLALELATRSTDNFPDGVFVIELAAVGDPAAVPEAVAAVLGVTQQPGLSVADSVAAALEGRSRLLVFDNCEHVLDAAADMIDAILSALVDGEDSGHQPRGTATGRRTTLAGAVAGECRNRLGGGDIVRRTRSGRRADHVTVEIRRRPCGGGDLPPTRRDSVGNRVGRIPPAVDDGDRRAGSAR